MKTFKKNNKGFSLVELIVVIAIMAVLGVAVALAVTKFIPQSQRSTDISNASMIAEAIEVAVNDFATAPEPGKIKVSDSVTVEKTNVINKTTGEVNLAELAKTGLLKSVPSVQGSSSDSKFAANAKKDDKIPFSVTYTESTGKVVVKIGTYNGKDVDLMDSDTAANYKNDTLSNAKALKS